MAIPVIDFAKCGLLIKNEEELEKCDVRKVGYELYEAFTTFGFAYLKGCGIPSETVNGVHDVAGKFFALPLEEKNKFFLPKSLTFCYDGLGTLHANHDRPRDLQEGFRVTAFDNDTKWPDVPHFQDKVEELQELCKHLSFRILKALGIGMKLKDPDYLYKCHEHMQQPGNYTMLKVQQYQPITENNPLLENQLRLGEHTDVGSLTLLFQDDIGGLQIETPDGKFIDATPIPDTVILNIGDALQFWSGGKLKSTVHRVVPPVDEDKRAKFRRSIALFAGPDFKAVLKKFEFEEDDIEEEKPENVEPDMTFEEYAMQRLGYLFPEISK